jgi:cell wall-associated NlpC family hydrolase
VTTDDLPTGLPAAPRALQPGVTRTLFCTAALCLASLTAQAQTAPSTLAATNVEDAGATVVAATTDATITEALPVATSAGKPSASSSVRDKAADAAAATLTALLPRLAANDTMPLLDRSATFAGDLSRLLANYDLTQTGVLAQQQSGGKIQTVLQRALTLLGTPYRWGGTSPDSGFDCSGLVGYVFRTALGIELPRVSRDMATKSDAELIKDRNDLQQGDLVFFGRKGRVNHVGIYVGEGRFLHSPSSGKDVRVDSLLTGYWSNKFLQARRVAM